MHHKRQKQGQRSCILASLNTEYHPPHRESSVVTGVRGEGGRTLHSAPCDFIILHKPACFCFVLTSKQQIIVQHPKQRAAIRILKLLLTRQRTGLPSPLLILENSKSMAQAKELHFVAGVLIHHLDPPFLASLRNLLERKLLEPHSKLTGTAPG